MTSLEPLVPLLFAVLVEAAAAQVVLVGLLAPGVMAEFEAGAELAIGEERRAHAGAECQKQFHAVALDGAVALHGGVIGHADGLLPALFQLALQRKIGPLGVQVDGGVYDAALDHARKAHRNAIEAGQARAQDVQRLAARRAVWARRESQCARAR